MCEMHLQTTITKDVFYAEYTVNQDCSDTLLLYAIAVHYTILKIYYIQYI